MLAHMLLHISRTLKRYHRRPAHLSPIHPNKKILRRTLIIVARNFTRRIPQKGHFYNPCPGHIANQITFPEANVLLLHTTFISVVSCRCMHVSQLQNFQCQISVLHHHLALSPVAICIACYSDMSSNIGI